VVATPAWIGASTRQPQLAAQINQFLGTHAITYLYAGASQGGQTTLGSGGVNSNGLYIAQSFTAGSSFALGRVTLDFSAVTGTPTAPTTVSVQTSSGGAPSGASLVSTTVPAQYPGGGVVSVPVPCSLTNGATYWIVLAAVGDASDYVTWLKSNQVSGASASATGTSWTAQAYGLYYALWDQSVTLPITHTYEDAGARWTTWAENANNQPASLKEYTVAQTAGDYVYSSRAMTYSSGSLIAVT
jgi:hypothetical protein